MSGSVLYLTTFLALCIVVTAFHVERRSASVWVELQQSSNFVVSRIVDGIDTDATAYGVAELSQDQTGWTMLSVESNVLDNDLAQAFAAGHIQGYLVEPVARHHLNNYRDLLNHSLHGNMTTKSAYDEFMLENIKFTMQGLGEFDGLHPRDQQVVLQGVMAQGYVQGFNAAAGSSALTLLELWSANAYGDSYEIIPYLEKRKTVAPNSEEAYLAQHFNHECSAFVSVGEDDLFIAHSTWTSYSNMMRTFTSLTLPFSSSAAKTVQYSSKPLFIHGKDDYAINDQGLLVSETTISVTDENTLAKTSPLTLLSWVREAVSLRMSKSGAEFVDFFSYKSSGTYSSTWHCVDSKKYDGGKLLPGLLTVYEEVPGTFTSSDRTDQLRADGYYASYNVPLHSVIDTASGNAALREHTTDPERRDEYDHEKCARSRIFKREMQNRPSSVYEAIDLIRHNEYKTDPVSKGRANVAICSRYDLLPKDDRLHSAFGCIDGKATSVKMMRENMGSYIQSGPTHGGANNIKPFKWSEFEGKAPLHVGQPDEFDFQPVYTFGHRGL